MSKLLQRLLLTNSPYDIEELEEVRIDILKEMKKKQFGHYTDQMKKLVNEIDIVLVDDKKTLDDDYWSNGSQKDIYWQKESPWLYKQYTTKKIKRLGGQPTGITSVTTILLRDSYVNQLIGSADWMTKQQIILFKTIISTYFKNNPRLWPIQLNMDFTFLNTRKQEQDKKTRNVTHKLLKTLFTSLLSGSGPFILKILQQINTGNSSKIDNKIDVSEITKDIFTSVPGLTSKEFQLVSNSFDISPSYIEKMNPKILGSASIAETHITYSDKFETKAILKFIKPMYAYYFLCECNYLLTDAWKTITNYADGDQKFIRQCRKLLMFFVKEFVKEFDYESEFIGTTLGYYFYNEPNSVVRSIIALEKSINPFPLLILQMVEGTSLDSLLKQDLSKERLIQIYKNADQLIRKWFKVTMWGPGFFHADLHPGNVLLNDQNVEFIIDYGSYGILTKKQQCLLITAMILSGQFTNMEKPELNTTKGKMIHQKNLLIAYKFVQTIWNVCGVEIKTKQQAKHLREISEKILDYPKLWFGSMFLSIVQFSDDIGQCANNAVLLFGRAMAYLSSIMKAITDKCEDHDVCPVWALDGIVRTNLLQHPGQLIHFFRKGVACGDPILNINY